MKTANHNKQVQLSNHHNATVTGRTGLVAALSLWFWLGINFLPIGNASAQAPLPPSLGPIPDQTTMEDLPLNIPLTVSDPDTPANSLIFTGGSSNTNLVSGISFTVTGSSVVATVHLVPNANGFAAVTISVSDGTINVSRDFALTVVPVDDRPVLGPIADQTTFENVPLSIPLTASDIDTEISRLVFTGTSSNPKLVSGVSFAVTGSNVVATLNLVHDAVGFAAVTITVSDGTTPVSRDFALTVTPADHRPVLGPITDKTTAQDVPLLVPLSVSDVGMDFSKLVFNGTSSNPNLVSGISFTVTGTSVVATVTPVAGASGFAAVTITVSDGTTSVSRDFALSVLKLPKLAASFSGQTLRVTLTGTPGNYVIEKATNLGAWTQTVNVTINSSGTGEISVSTMGVPQQFFRVTTQ